MASQQRGLPSGFSLKVSPSATERPVNIGDYLDDDTPVPVVPRRTPPPSQRKPPEQAPQREPAPQRDPTPQREVPSVREAVVRSIEPEPQVMPEPVIYAVPTEQQEEPSTAEVQAVAVRKGPPRKQINMKPDTLRKAEELLQHVQRFSVQKDTKASEVFDALVDLIHDARKFLDVSSVPPRGQWGSPTARGFRTSLKNAFAKAIAQLNDNQQSDN
jgi:hypothetical protein